MRWPRVSMAHTHIEPAELWQGRKCILPGCIEAVVGAHSIVSEELLAAVCAGFCVHRQKKKTLFRKVMVPEQQTHRRLVGLSSICPTKHEICSPGKRSGEKMRPRVCGLTLKMWGMCKNTGADPWRIKELRFKWRQSPGYRREAGGKLQSRRGHSPSSCDVTADCTWNLLEQHPQSDTPSLLAKLRTCR